MAKRCLSPAASIKGLKLQTELYVLRIAVRDAKKKSPLANAKTTAEQAFVKADNALRKGDAKTAAEAIVALGRTIPQITKTLPAYNYFRYQYNVSR